MPQNATRLPHSASIRVRPRADRTLAFDVRYRIDGASKTTSFDDKDAAERWANIVRHIGPEAALDLLRGDSRGHAPTVHEYAERYIAGKSGIEGRTTDKYRTYLRTSISPLLGPLPLDAVTPDRISAWVNAQADAGDAGKTIANRHGFLAGMFNQAVHEGILTRSPCARTRLPKTEKKEMVFLSYAEFELLYGYIPSHYKPFILTLALTGMRFSEAAALHPGDFDLQARTVRIARAWKRSVDKGYYVSAPKTAKSRRTVSIPPELATALAPLLRGGGSEYIFTNGDGGPIRQPTFFMRTWQPAVRLAQGQLPFRDKDGKPRAAMMETEWKSLKPADPPLQKTPNIHSLRHTHVAWLLNAGVGLDVIQLRLGHESIKTTIDVYGPLVPDRLFAPSDALAGKLTLTA